MVSVTELEGWFGAPDVFGAASVLMLDGGVIYYFGATTLARCWAWCFVVAVASRVFVCFFPLTRRSYCVYA